MIDGTGSYGESILSDSGPHRGKDGGTAWFLAKPGGKSLHTRRGRAGQRLALYLYASKRKMIRFPVRRSVFRIRVRQGKFPAGVAFLTKVVYNKSCFCVAAANKTRTGSVFRQSPSR